MENQGASKLDVSIIRQEVFKNEQEQYERLNAGLKASFISLDAFQDWIAAEMKKIGLVVEEFKVDIEELAGQPGNLVSLKENPEIFQKGRNVVGKIPGQGPRKGMLLFGHADKRPETFEWAKEKPEIVKKEGRLYGPGIADDVSGITAMLSAAETFKSLGLHPQGDLLVASILGKQMGIFGTYGLVKRYGPLDAAIYAHPAETGDGLADLKMASLGNLEFIIHIEGKKPDTNESHHTIFSKSAINPIQKASYLMAGLEEWAAGEAKKYPHSWLETHTGQSLGLNFGRILAGQENEVYQIPVKAVVAGLVAFPPNARLKDIKDSLQSTFNSLVEKDKWLSQGKATLTWGDHIDESCQADEDGEFIQMAIKAIKDVTGKEPIPYYAHSISDIRYPMLYWDAQALGVGPLAGNLGTPDEWLDWRDYLDMIIVVTEMLKNAA